MAESTLAVPAWPAPDAHAQAHSETLVQLIRERIAGSGALPFDRFMDLALYAPGLGYYAAGSAKFGGAGDFTTAPELTPVFARCIARHCAAWLEENPAWGIVEFGAGTGRLAADLLTSLEGSGRLPGYYAIVEPSPDLRARQRATLAAQAPAIAERVSWWETLPASPVDAVVIANEVLDALPVKCLASGPAGLVERCVDHDGDGFRWVDREPTPALSAHVRDYLADSLAPLEAGFRSECCVAAPAWLNSVADLLSAGVLLLFDYGYPRHEYYHPQRAGGTLRCHYRHRAHDDVFFLPGLQDITAAVDFTSLAEAADLAGFTVAGYTTQAAFLLGSGLEAVTGGGLDADPGAAARLKQLLLPGSMGEFVKAMLLTRNSSVQPGAFGFSDQRHRLLPTI